MKPKARKDKTSLLFISLLLMLPFVISYSMLCKYFRNAVLPAEPMLEAAILGTRFERCVSCGAPILKKGNRKKYCGKCAVRAYKKQQAEYARRKRAESKNRG